MGRACRAEAMKVSVLLNLNKKTTYLFLAKTSQLGFYPSKIQDQPNLVGSFLSPMKDGY
jgi:hypothetical protein